MVERLRWLLCLTIDSVMWLLFVLSFVVAFVLEIFPVTSYGSEISIVPKALRRSVLDQVGLVSMFCLEFHLRSLRRTSFCGFSCFRMDVYFPPWV